MPRIRWDELPAAARRAVADHTGDIITTAPSTRSGPSGFATMLHTAAGAVLVKGVPLAHPQVRTQQREAEVNPYLPATCPRLLWHVRAGGWALLGYELIVARQAVYEPGSPDLPRVETAVAELQHTQLPAGAPAQDAAERWAEYAGSEDASPLTGTTLLHTDLAPHNVLISGRARVTGWTRPTRGAAWIDPAVLILRLMDAGHTAADADMWAKRFPAWAEAPRTHVQLFNQLNARRWSALATEDPQPWKQRMAELARAWASHWEG